MEPRTDPLSWLTQQADELGLKVAGVERLPTSKVLEYEQVPINITVKGDYNLLGMFINRLERFSFHRVTRTEYKHLQDRLTQDGSQGIVTRPDCNDSVAIILPKGW